MSKATQKFGTGNLSTLLIEQAVPASIGILVISIYGIVDTIFVGRWVGVLGIGAITVVLPITILISSLGMAVGIGGSSMMARALGAGFPEKSANIFGNQVVLTVGLASLFAFLGTVFMENILGLFGAKGEVLPYASAYFSVLLPGIPFLAWSMMSGNVIRTIGFPKLAMYTMLIPALTNVVLDPVFIVYLDLGMRGAGLATTVSYAMSASYAIYIFFFRQKEFQIHLSHFIPRFALIREMLSLGSVTFARQGVISLLSIVLNNSLFALGGEPALSIYGILSRVLMFANFPVVGITQGFVPILGYNYGARLMDRVNQLVKLAVKYATVIALIIFSLIMSFTPALVSVFTADAELIQRAVPALRVMFIATPLIAVNLLGSAYFQSIGQALPSLLLTLTKQGFFLIPLILILPNFFGLNGIWMSFPIADTGAALVTLLFFKIKEKKVSLI